MRITYVVNPASQNGNTGRRWNEIAKKLPTAHETLFTQKVGDGISLARAAADAGAECVCSVGGDGTLNEVTSGLMLVPKEKRPALGLVPMGTGGDFRRTLGYPHDLRAIAAILDRGATRPVDIGALTYRTREGGDAVRHFLNECSFGASGEVVEQVNKTSKALGGKASFLIGTVRGLLKFRTPTVEISVDGEPFETKRITWVATCNGRALGGGMFIAPTADPSDGRFELVEIGAMKSLVDALGLRKIYNGDHLSLDLVRYRTVKRLVAKSNDTVLIDVDGEQLGRLPIEIELLPHALNVVC